MPASNKRDPRAYRTPGVVDGNLAHDLRRHELERELERSGQIDFDQQYRQSRETRADQLSRRRQEVKAAVRKPQGIPVMEVACGAALAVLAVLIISCHVGINGISADIVSMKKQIAELELQQVSLQTQYEQAFDPASVKEAAEAVGMHQPSEGQIYYIDLPGEDQAVMCEQREEGTLKKIFSALTENVRALLEYFS